MQSFLFAICVICAFSTAFSARHLLEFDIDDTDCCAALSNTRTGSLLVARDHDRDDCEADDDDERRIFNYFLYKDSTCYVESSYPCSRFVRDGEGDDDDFTRMCTDTEAADYNNQYSAAVEELRTQAGSGAASPPPPPPSGDDDDDDDESSGDNGGGDDDDDDEENSGDNGSDDDGNDNDENNNSSNNSRTAADFCNDCQTRCQQLCQVSDLTAGGASIYTTQCNICGNAGGICSCGSTSG